MTFEAAHALPQLVNHLVVSCGIGLAGIVGAKATEEVRALSAGDSQADEMATLALEIDSFRRRNELAARPGDRDWTEVTVDRFSNVVVAPELVPELDSYDDLKAFDRLLTQQVDASAPTSNSLSHSTPLLVDPAHFVWHNDTSHRSQPHTSPPESDDSHHPQQNEQQHQ
ncbi:hypothetical protein BWQ96_09004 [Gracilariopsis chorda]|uniref:Uncharacterized protein n=1 Tax=Gracilariopsis chorda TaxID=448386 RepID=A0A2V3IGN0_9FLOR|nr:hypothetical protein BWQ96_09004 [Gracilariopsis chorda]|eukprot:PXF41244.1 hypothetical protein BWQ96_09004 [Gracilariopsis chorda]